MGRGVRVMYKVLSPWSLPWRGAEAVLTLELRVVLVTVNMWLLFSYKEINMLLVCDLTEISGLGAWN